MVNHRKQAELGNENQKTYDADLLLKSARNHLSLFRKITEGEFQSLLPQISNQTMLSIERLYDLHLAVNYINKAKIPGSILEVGTWKGGALGMALLSDKTKKRKVIGFDTFAGHYRPNQDELDIRGNSMQDRWLQMNSRGERWAEASKSECLDFLVKLTGGDASRIELVEGDVKETGKCYPVTRLAILRIDCDWYPESLASLEYFWPMLQPNGVLIMDDYGHHSGQKRAFDEYFSQDPQRFSHVDYSCITVCKRN